MTTQFMEIADEASWLAKRKLYVTSTESAALFGISPYTTAFELYHAKREGYEAKREENNYMLFGKLLEQPICDMIKVEHPDWEILPMNVFAFDDDDKIGTSFDRIVIIDGKKYLLELKSINYAEYMKHYVEHSPTDIEAPQHYEVQMQHQLELVRGDYEGILQCVFILDVRTLVYIFRQPDAEMGADIRAAVKEFWAMAEAPAPDFARDKSVLAKVLPSADPNRTLDATKDAEITSLAAQYKAACEVEKYAKDEKEKVYAELMFRVGHARYIWTDYHKMTISDVAASEGTEVTLEMVGTRINQRSAFKKVTVTELKKKEGKS